MPFRVPNVGTVGITLLFKFRIAVRIRTVSGGNDFGFFGRWTFGTDNEQDTSQATASFCLSMLFEELFRNISFFHRFLAPERHSCQKVGVTKRFDQTDVAAAFATQYKSFPENRGSELRVSGSKRRIGGAS